MPEKKTSLFGRLLGKGEEKPAPTPQAPTDPVQEKISGETETASVNAPNNQDEKPKNWFSRLKDGLAKSSNKLTSSIGALFTQKKLDDDTLQDLEDILVQADIGIATATRITEKLAQERYDKTVTSEEVRQFLSDEVKKVLTEVAHPLEIDARNQPHIILVAGVNGAGKTTTIGKLARKFKNEGKSVMLAAGDTFRAAAIEQLKVWAERVDAPFVSKEIGSDAAALAYEAINAAKDQNIDILMIDTAGRLQNKTELMEELKKVIRVIRKLVPDAPHTSLLVLDATTGQNALQQVEVFKETAETTGLIMTKLDGTARGGILVAIADKFKMPVHAIGVGEQIEDLQPFDAEEFADALTTE